MLMYFSMGLRTSFIDEVSSKIQDIILEHLSKEGQISVKGSSVCSLSFRYSF